MIQLRLSEMVKLSVKENKEGCSKTTTKERCEEIGSTSHWWIPVICYYHVELIVVKTDSHFQIRHYVNMYLQ